MILDICTALAALLGSEAKVVILDAEPLKWQPEHLYVYPMRVEEVPFETGNSRRQEFDLNAVYVTDNLGEEAQQVRSEELALTLDAMRDRFMTAVRRNQATELWGSLRAMTDTTGPRTLDKRSAAIRVSGWRVIAGGI